VRTGREVARPDLSDDTVGTLNREQTLEQILDLNPTASLDFLDRFETGLLSNYLRHLIAASRPRGRESGWLRPGDAPAIVSWPAHSRARPARPARVNAREAGLSAVSAAA
jgi:hypothetical protein